MPRPSRFVDPRRVFAFVFSTAGLLLSILTHLIPGLTRLPFLRPALQEQEQQQQQQTQPSQRSRLAKPRPLLSETSSASSPHVTTLVQPGSKRTGSRPPLGRRCFSDPSTSNSTISISPTVSTASLHSSQEDHALTSLPSPYLHPHAIPSHASLADENEIEILPPTKAAVPLLSLDKPEICRKRLARRKARKNAEASDLSEGDADQGWRGTSAFAVKRAGTVDSSVQSPRRKFSLFAPRTRTTAATQSSGSSPSSLTQSLEPVPPVPLGDVSHLSLSPSSSDPLALALTTTPPQRPQRAPNPYVTLGLPPPGSDRAREFRRQERAREKHIEQLQEARQAHAQAQAQEAPPQPQEALASPVQAEPPSNPTCKPRKRLSLKRAPPTAYSPPHQGALSLPPAAAAESESEVAEFGALPGKKLRSWRFARRSTGTATDREDVEEKTSKPSKQKDSKRPKSSHQTHKRSVFSRKSGGYVSDSGVAAP